MSPQVVREQPVWGFSEGDLIVPQPFCGNHTGPCGPKVLDRVPSVTHDEKWIRKALKVPVKVEC